MNFFGRTDKGKKRRLNQDCFGAYALSRDAALIIVCDGMGGEAGGETASLLALDAFVRCVVQMCKPKLNGDSLALADRDAELMINNAISRANLTVYDYAKLHPEFTGMGTTLVAALILDEGKKVFWVNVGDSRLYFIKDGRIAQLSHDHSYVQYLVDIGELSADEAMANPDKNIITRAIGIDLTVDPDITALRIPDKDTSDTYILLCSDGLSNMVEDEDILETVLSDRTVEQKTDVLVKLANQNGGADNITVVLARL